jgi:uncharacterized membrane protein YhaH (DUF805 family)
MYMPEAVGSVYRNYATGSGRAGLSEYWLYYLLNVIVYTVVWCVALGVSSAAHNTAEGNPVALGATAIIVIWLLANVIPSIAVTVRRLHDVNMSGAFYFLHLIPYLGSLALFIITLLPGTRGSNNYGVDPRDRTSSRGYSQAGARSQGPIPQNAFATTRITPPDYVPPMQGPPGYVAPGPYVQQPPAAPGYVPQPPPPPYVQQPPPSPYPQQPPAPPYVQQPPPTPYVQQPPPPPYVQQPPPPPYAQQPPPPPYAQQPPPPHGH